MEEKDLLKKAEQALAAFDYGLVEEITKKAGRPPVTPANAPLVRVRALALLRNGGTADAQGLFFSAIAKGADPGPLGPQIRVDLADLLVDQSLHRQALEVLDGIDPAVAEAGVRRRADVLRAHALSSLGDHVSAIKALTGVAAEARDAGDKLALADASNRMSLVEYRRGHVAEAETWAREALAAQSGLPPGPVLGRTHRYLAILANVQCRFDEALEHHEKEINAFKRLRHMRGQCRGLLGLAMTSLGMGEMELAEHHLKKAQRLAETDQDESSLSVTYSRLGILMLSRGQAAQALKLFEKDLAIARKAETPHNSAYPLRNIGRALCALGKNEEARAPLDESIGIFRDMGDTVNLALSLVERASCECDCRNRPLASALSRLDEARSLIEGVGREQLIAQVETAEANIRARLREMERAEECFARGVDVWLKHEALARSVEAYLSFGDALVAGGDRERALRYLRRGLDVARQTGQLDSARIFLEKIDAISDGPVVARVRRDSSSEPPRPVSGVHSAPITGRNLTARSAAMRKVLELAEKVAPADLPVLITGETGTGKELVARFIHWHSPRRASPMVVVNCGAIPKDLVESTLFGHVSGAFTGAVADKSGSFDLAHGGTLFLDEIGDLPLDSQVKLLRALQSGEITRVGDPKTIRVNVRIIAATNRRLLDEVQGGRFREDLYFRLNVFPIHIPPLRDRPEDIPALVEHMISNEKDLRDRGVRQVSREAMKLLKRHRWPGNARELFNALQRAAVLCRGGVVLAEDLPDSVTAPSGGGSGRFPTLSEITGAHIKSALDAAGGNQTRAARLLGVHRNTLLKRLSKK
jgi:DNA-binding NtrC family response regulator/predicted negative regulator of RcsB-dependent stress response